MFYEENKISNAIKAAGWLIIIFGILGALMLGSAFPVYTHGEESYNWILALGGGAAYGVSGLLCLAVAEIIDLLDSIERTTKKSCDKIVAALKKFEEKTT